MLTRLIRLRLRGLLARLAGKAGRRGRGYVLLLAFLMLYCLGAFGLLLYQLFSTLARGLAGGGLEWYYFALTGMLAFSASFLLTVFAAKSELFEARDTALLLAMPIRPSTILLSKLSALLLLELGFTLAVFLPAALAWFGQVGFDAAVLGLLLLGALLLPFLTVSLSALVGWLLSLLLSRTRHKALLSTLFALVFLGGYFYLSFTSQDYLTALVSNAGAMASVLESWALPFVWLARGMSGSLGQLALFALVAGALFALTLALLSRSFLRLSAGGSSRGSRRKQGRRARLQRRSVAAALRHRELRRLLSSPTYLLNSATGALLGLLAAGALLIKGPELRQLLQSLGAGLSSTELSLLASVVLGFFSSMYCLTSPSVSLEGKTLWLLRSAPLSGRQILSAKLWLNGAVGLVPTAALSAATALVLRPGPVGVLVLLLIPQLFLQLSGAVGLWANLLLPRLNWVSEAQAVKQSGAVVLSMLGQMAYHGLAIAGIFLLELSLPLYFGLYLLLSALLLAGLLGWIFTRGAARFEAL